MSSDRIDIEAIEIKTHIVKSMIQALYDCVSSDLSDIKRYEWALYHLEDLTYDIIKDLKSLMDVTGTFVLKKGVD